MRPRVARGRSGGNRYVNQGPLWTFWRDKHQISLKEMEDGTDQIREESDPTQREASDQKGSKAPKKSSATQYAPRPDGRDYEKRSFYPSRKVSRNSTSADSSAETRPKRGRPKGGTKGEGRTK